MLPAKLYCTRADLAVYSPDGSRVQTVMSSSISSAEKPLSAIRDQVVAEKVPLVFEVMVCKYTSKACYYSIFLLPSDGTVCIRASNMCKNRSQLWCCHDRCAAVHGGPCKRAQTPWNIYDRKKLQLQQPHMHKKEYHQVLQFNQTLQYIRYSIEACRNYFHSLKCKLLQFLH